MVFLHGAQIRKDDIPHGTDHPHRTENTLSLSIPDRNQILHLISKIVVSGGHLLCQVLVEGQTNYG